jgi:hypothetical protein
MTSEPVNPKKNEVNGKLAYHLLMKPDPTVCPRHFCFFWQMGRVIHSQAAEPQSVAEGCCNPFRVCRRLDPEHGQQDSYEDHGPNLREARLPWFYFYSSPDSLIPEVREKYITESDAVWGKEHWKR